MSKIHKFSLLLIMILLSCSTVYALEYTVSVTSPSSVDEYAGDKITDEFNFVITNNGDYCDIICSWVTTADQDGDIKVAHDGGKSSRVDFSVNAIGYNGVADYDLLINCERDNEPLNCFSSSEDYSYSNSFKFLWNGDGVCSTSREKCANYKTYLKDSTCICSSSKECNPSSSRDVDPKGCVTFCGNGIKESKYETCNNCRDDVGKCDGESCTRSLQCEGNYCVHNKCSHTPYIKGDKYCDKNVEENCLNSPSDCSCESYEMCNSQGICETYCGNGICESSEQGICNADCQWCGDGICDPEKESCKGCSQDCGECEQTESEEQITQELVKIKQEAQVSAQITKDNKMVINITIGSTLGLIILIITIYLFYKSVKSKKEVNTPQNIKEEPVKKEILKNECPKCHTKIKGTNKFCPECGYALNKNNNFVKEDNKKNNICPKCDSKIKKNAKFCNNCEYKIK